MINQVEFRQLCDDEQNGGNVSKNWIPEWAEPVAASLLEALRQKDVYTHGHCVRVGWYARLLARSAGLSEMDQNMAEYAGVFHDIGKISVPSAILNKPAKLTPEEAAIMDLHPVKSVEILQHFEKIPFFRGLFPGVRHHHERMDGKGYPDKISGESIPLLSRIILVVDTFDAMITTRAYRKGLPKDVAFEELRKFSGTQFDPALVKIFLRDYPEWGEVGREISEDFLVQRIKKAA